MSLPIHEVLPALRQALGARAAAVLVAPPGAGKTTAVPLALLGEPWLGGGIVMLEPRRLAARAAAARMASLLCERVGQTVGHRVRFDSRVSAQTRIEVVTEGILTRRVQTDPGLEGVSLVIFDEFHERHLHTDLALALTLDVQRQLREDLKILIMSATLDAGPIAALLGDAPVIRSEGRLHPVAVHHATREPEKPLPEVVSQAVERALLRDPGDVLVFLPGAREIRRTCALLEDRVARDVDILPLYGDLPWEQQDRALQSMPGRRKVVLATPIAETSLTIEGVRVMVDAGLVRVPRLDAPSRLTRLVTQRISRASSEQRAGRAGRLAPGVCYRLWTEATHSSLLAHAVPEIRAADLAGLALELASWGVSCPAALSWLDPPPPGAWAAARALLGELDAVEESGRITAAGRAMVALPLHPRLAHMLHAARDLQLGALACDLAAILSERDVLAGERRRSCDLMERVEALHAWRERRNSRGVDAAACQRADRAAAQLLRLLGRDAGAARARSGAAGAAGARSGAAATATEEVGAAGGSGVMAERVGMLLSLAYPDRVARARQPGDARYVLASGRGARLPERAHGLRVPYLVAASLDAGDGEALIHLAAPIDIEALRRHLPGRLRIEDEVRWDARQEAVVAERVERLGKLVLTSQPLHTPDSEAVRAALLHGIRDVGMAALPWTERARELQARVLCMRQWFAEASWPDLSDTALLADLDAWLAPHVEGMSRRADLARVDLLAALEALLDWRQRQRLDAEAPTHWLVPSGARRKLAYTPGEPPVLSVKLQEMFGQADTPRIAAGRVAVTLHLLSPAGRPIQVTQDLKSFWDRTYAEVKKELKGRYPKHPWPDDPWTATPTARTQRRR